jgi:hypothetical protein
MSKFNELYDKILEGVDSKGYLKSSNPGDNQLYDDGKPKILIYSFSDMGKFNYFKGAIMRQFPTKQVEEVEGQYLPKDKLCLKIYSDNENEELVINELAAQHGGVPFDADGIEKEPMIYNR